MGVHANLATVIQAGLLTSPPQALPSHPLGTVANKANEVPETQWIGRGHSGGPVSESHGVPFLAPMEHLHDIPLPNSGS